MSDTSSTRMALLNRHWDATFVHVWSAWPSDARSSCVLSITQYVCTCTHPLHACQVRTTQVRSIGLTCDSDSNIMMFICMKRKGTNTFPGNSVSAFSLTQIDRTIKAHGQMFVARTRSQRELTREASHARAAERQSLQVRPETSCKIDHRKLTTSCSHAV
jgi:hypothetical protein